MWRRKTGVVAAQMRRIDAMRTADCAITWNSNPAALPFVEGGPPSSPMQAQLIPAQIRSGRRRGSRFWAFDAIRTRSEGHEDNKLFLPPHVGIGSN